MTSRTAVLLHFSESDVPPSDDAGGLLDLLPTGSAAPSSVYAFVGLGRRFTNGVALAAKEKTADQTRLTRSMAIEAIINFDQAAGNDGTYTICCRGLSGSDAERRLYGLQIVVDTDVYTLQMFWQDSAGTNATVAGATFDLPDGYFYVAAVRRWVAADSVEVDYYLNGLSLGTVSSSDGDIGNGEDGTFVVGAKKGATYEDFFKDVIDELRISSDERAPEEILQTYNQIFLYQIQAYESIKALLPPGEAYSKDPSSSIQQELAIEGDILGTAFGIAQELDDDFLPDRASKSLARWEAVTGLSPQPTDSIATRRGRVLAFLRKIHGYSKSKIAEAVYQLLGVTLDQVEFIENSNRTVDTFAGSDLDLRWFQEANEGTLTLSSGVLTVAFQVGDDATWTSTAVRKAVALRTSIDGGEGEIAVSIPTLTVNADGDFVGVYLCSAFSLDAHLFGVEKVSGTRRFVSRKITNDAMSAATVLDDTITAPDSDVWLRITPQRQRSGWVWLQYSTVGFDGPWLDFDTGLGAQETIDPVFWAGIFAMAQTNPATGTTSIGVDECRIWMPKSTRVFQWFIFVDPDIIDPPLDRATAQAVIQKMKPAHTRGRVCVQRTFQCDDEYSHCDQEPLGG